MTRLYTAYILANHSRRLYVGFSGDLRTRMWKHKTRYHGGYAARCFLDRLVYFETTDNARAAIAREKQLKRWPRWRKVRLIEQHNPDWRDLSEGWFDGPSIASPPGPTRR